MFRDFQPDAILVEGVLVRVEPPQSPSVPRVSIIVLIQRRILMVTKHDALTGPTLPPASPALRALRSFLVALELTGATGEAVERFGEQSAFIPRHAALDAIIL